MVNWTDFMNFLSQNTKKKVKAAYFLYKMKESEAIVTLSQVK